MNPEGPASGAGLNRLYIIAGEPSGEAHAAHVVRALKLQQPAIEIRGMGGDAMAAEGVGLVEHVRNTSIMGFAEVIGKLGFIRALMERIKADIMTFNPNRILLVDYPGFNLRLATWARQKGFSTDMYIAPQVWAWKRRRIHRMARDLDRLYVILPFEAPHYDEVDLTVEYVGHPLADVIEAPKQTHRNGEAWRKAQGLPADAPLLALLPGSRPQEIQRMLPVLEDAARLIPDLVPVIAGAPGRSREDYDTDLTVLFGQTAMLYRTATAGIITSGTATLEAALHGLPQVVAYKTSGFTYRLAKWYTQVRFISLVNLVLDEAAVPERIQGACHPHALAATLKETITDQGLQAQREHHSNLRKILAGKGAAEAVARGIMRG